MRKTRPPKPGKKVTSLSELLRQVRAGGRTQNAEDKRREAEFAAQKDKQTALLKAAKATLVRLQKRGDNLEKTFDKNESEIARMEETLKIRLGTMGELFGVIRQVAGDTRSVLDVSLTSAQYPGRGDILEPLAQSKRLPEINQLEQLWALLQQEMIESGKVIRFKASVEGIDGKKSEREVIRVGVFNVLANGEFLHWKTDATPHVLKELGRQPPSRYLAGLSKLENAKEGYNRVAVDPSRGNLLGLLLETPTLAERVDQGGTIGYIIIGLGAIALLVGLIRMLILLFVSLRIRTQKSNTKVITDNPLGRVLEVYSKNPNLSSEGLEHKLDEAIMRESTRARTLFVGDQDRLGRCSAVGSVGYGHRYDQDIPVDHSLWYR